jgi:hypothetical protein
VLVARFETHHSMEFSLAMVGFPGPRYVGPGSTKWLILAATVSDDIQIRETKSLSS